MMHAPVIQVGLGLVLHEADNIFDTGGLPLDDIVAISLLLFFGIRTLQVRLANTSCWWDGHLLKVS